jgi:hypothetical protein
MSTFSKPDFCRCFAANSGAPIIEPWREQSLRPWLRGMDDLLRYPAYGSCRKGDFRLPARGDHRNPEKLQDDIYRACMNRAKDCANSPALRRDFCTHRFLGHGWEWSVFEDGEYVIKVPAGAFPEVDDSQYLENARHNFSVIRRHIDPKFLAETEFSRVCLNTIRQRKLHAPIKQVAFESRERATWLALTRQLHALLVAEDWLPDLDIHLHHDRFDIRSIMAAEDGMPKIMDFTAYFDVFRLYEERMRAEVKNRREVLKQIAKRLEA